VSTDDDNNNNSNIDDLSIASLAISNSNDDNDTNVVVAASSLPFPKDGIRLSSLYEFYDICGGKDKLIGLTTTDVNEMYQKPLTASSGLSYCEYLKSKNSVNVGQAVVFISHGKYLFTFTLTINICTITFNTTNVTYTNTTTTTHSMEIPVLRSYGCRRVSFS